MVVDWKGGVQDRFKHWCQTQAGNERLGGLVPDPGMEGIMAGVESQDEGHTPSRVVILT
ncbi:hypothetical protein BMS3Abin14_00380 [bacterium BMS3Abin14]|nr:hypothetical protein BMS3Abin14_00380 [bacterium BMS3Abin14]